jgi:chemotaxis protein methyltransferase CheR
VTALPAIDPAALEVAERALARACGVQLSPGMRRTLEAGLRRAAEEATAGLPELLARLEAGDPAATAALVDATVVGETYFFRHPEQLSAIRREVIEPAPRDRPLAIWSAGCASGEEPYTLAILLAQCGRAGLGDRILATDVSERALARARAGVYGRWSFRRTDPDTRAAWFTGPSDAAAVADPLRSAVAFRRHDLCSEPPPETGVDLVVCRNVLIYFGAPTAVAVIEKLLSAVRPGGHLVLGPVELPLASTSAAEMVQVGGATLLRRVE